MNDICCWSNLEKKSYYNMLYFVLLLGFSLFGKLQDSLNKLMKNR